MVSGVYRVNGVPSCCRLLRKSGPSVVSGGVATRGLV